MQQRHPIGENRVRRLGRLRDRRGLTLVELIVAFTILLILSTMALPVAKVKVAREKERRLRDGLYEIRRAIDRYKDAADQGILGDIDPDNHGYPENLEVLVEGVDVNPAGGMGGPGGMPGAGGIGGMPGAQGANQGSGFGSRGNSRSRGGRGGGFGSSNSRGSSSGGFGSSRSSSSRSSRSGSGGFGSNRQDSRSNRSGGFGSSSGFGSDEEESGKMRFLRRIPIDPMTGSAEWGMRSVSDSPDSMSWGGDNVFDVFSLSTKPSLDGTPYSEW